MSEDKHICRECKWLKGERTSHGIECMQPDNQAKWDRNKTLWMGEYRMPHARWKHPIAQACKRFETIE